jgi:hypothetical protein
VDAGTLSPALAGGRLIRALSLRGTAHVFAADDVAVFTTGVLPTPGDEAATRRALGSCWPVFEALGVDAVDAVSGVRDHILEVVADGRGRAKGEISESLHGRLPPEWEPWCERCRAHHVPDLLFRLSAVAAGLRFAAGQDGDDNGGGDGNQLVPGPPPDLGGHEAARQELVRRFLSAYAPATAQAFADWCGLGLAEAKASWAALGDEIATVRLAGRSAHALTRDLDRLPDPPPVEGVRLVPAGDPFLHQRDRATLVDDPARRRALWRPAGAPGLVLVDGAPAGVWRHKQAKDRLVVTVEPWTDRLGRRRSVLGDEVALQAATHGVDRDRVQLELGS